MEPQPKSPRFAETVNGNVATIWLVSLLLLSHVALLAHAATRHSPTLNEPGHLIAGLTQWKFGRFEVYRVTPPLTQFVAAIPVIYVGYEEDWTGFCDSPSARPEFKMGQDFIRANGERCNWLFTIARWACIPFSVVGALFCFFWSRALWGSNVAGLISLALWCFDPNILAHGELVTPDCAATSFGLGAAYLFWEWLRNPTWEKAVIAGAMLGAAELTKTVWILLFGLWPVLWLAWTWLNSRKSRETSKKESLPPILMQLLQLASLLLIALYILNAAYGFDGTFTRLKAFQFVSKALSGRNESGTPSNRFTNTWLAEVPVPLPEQYLQGIDLQKRDFEDYSQPSYLRGEWKHGGWWYYYIYGLAVKTPHSSQAALVLSIFGLFVLRKRGSLTKNPIDPTRSITNPRVLTLDIAVLFAPALLVLVLVSSQLQFNHHVRYVLPVLGFTYVFAGANTAWYSLAARR